MLRLMKSYPFLLMFLALFLANAQAKSIIREGEPIITFKKLYVPQTLNQGELYNISADMMTEKNIWDNMSLFFHITKAGDDKIIINNDFGLSLPSVQWTPGEIVKVGSALGYIPQDLAPGDYDIKMGLFSSKISPEGVVYVREPYTNKEIKDFVVGKINVREFNAQEAKKKEDLIISNFETLVELRKWQPRQCTIEQDTENVAEGKFAAKITYLKNQGCCPSAILESFFNYSDPKYSNWINYDMLQFQIYGAKDSEGRTYLKYPVSIQVKDSAERRYQWPIPTTQEKGKPMTFLLSEINKVVDVTGIKNLSFWVAGTPPDTDWVIYLDDIRLVSLGVDKQKDTFVRFEGIKISPDKVKPGESIEISPSFSTTQRFTEDYGLYIHIYRSTDKAGWFNADTSFSSPTTAWEVNKIVPQGPYIIYIPPQSPPGIYSIEMGLFLAKELPQGTQYVKYHRGNNGTYFIEQPSLPLDYFKLPYLNYEQYGDRVVGNFEVTKP
jgi:hypothetical protein